MFVTWSEMFFGPPICGLWQFYVKCVCALRASTQGLRQGFEGVCRREERRVVNKYLLIFSPWDGGGSEEKSPLRVCY